MQKKLPHWVPLIIFLAAGLWLIFLTQGLPVGDPDDWDHVLAASDLSWSTLIKNFSIPWSQSTLWSGQVDRMNEVLHRRLFRSFILKGSVDLFGYHAFPFYFFSKVLFFSGTVTILFLLIHSITSSYFASFAGTVFYFFVPAHYTHVLWLSDPDTIVHFLMVLGIFIYLKILKRLDQNDHPSGIFIVALIAIGWTAMKTKESALILPLALGFYTLIHLFQSRKRLKEHFILISIFAFLAFFIVPISVLKNQSSGSPLHFNFDVLNRLIFRNYRCGYEDEQVSAFFSTLSVWPVSIARTFGFYLLWALVASVILYLIRRTHKKYIFFGDHLPGICFLWVLIWLFFAGTFQPDPRYFSGVMIPLTILSVQLFHQVISSYGGKIKWLILSVVYFSVASALLENIQHVCFLRALIGQRTDRFFNIGQSIYEDRYGKSTLSNIGRYYSASYKRDQTNQRRLEEDTYYVEMDYALWNRSNNPNIEEYKLFTKKGFPYYATFDKNLMQQDSRIQLIREISGINQSLFEHLYYLLKKKTPGPMYVFKFVESPV